MNPDWFILVEQWVPQQMGYHGVTLPFVVGALAVKAGAAQAEAEQVAGILDAIIRNPVPDFVTEVSWCSDIGAPVLSAKKLNAPDRMKPKATILQPGSERESLIFSFSLSSHWSLHDAAALRQRLQKDAEEPVRNGLYSRVRDPDSFQFAYGAFSPRELRYIDETIIRPHGGKQK